MLSMSSSKLEDGVFHFVFCPRLGYGQKIYLNIKLGPGDEAMLALSSLRRWEQGVLKSFILRYAHAVPVIIKR